MIPTPVTFNAINHCPPVITEHRAEVGAETERGRGQAAGRTERRGRSEHTAGAESRAEQSGQADQRRDQRQRERNGNLSTGAEHGAVSGVAPPGQPGGQVC